VHVVIRARWSGRRGGAAVDQGRLLLDLLRLAFDDADQAVQVDGGEVAHARLSSGQVPSAGLRSEAQAGSR
jgi:hypothetical protein